MVLLAKEVDRRYGQNILSISLNPGSTLVDSVTPLYAYLTDRYQDGPYALHPFGWLEDCKLASQRFGEIRLL